MMIRLLFLVSSLSQLKGVLCAVITEGDLTVFAGDSLKIPCQYPPEYTSNVKYWCQGYFQDFCTYLARTDEQNTGSSSAGRVTIADDPTQQVFTVTMHEMKESGWFWCGVELGQIWTRDFGKSVYITVKQGITVKNNEVSAEEEGNVTVQCLYSEKHRKDEKKWCRSGNLESCTVTNKETFSSKSLLISDNRKNMVTVTMKQLAIRDTGWYYCGAGEHQIPVHVSVTPRSTTTAAPNVKPQMNVTEAPEEARYFNGYILQWFLLAFGAMLLFVIIFTRRIRREYKPLTDQDIKEKDIIVV